MTSSDTAIPPSSFWRVFACSSRVFCRILSNVIADGSVGWFCQIVLGSFSGESSRMAASFAKPPRQDILDPVYPHRHASGRQTRDFSNRRRVHAFEIGDDDLAVKRLELLNQHRQPLQIDALVRGELAVVFV